jgi:orotidine-5'-phosphate decarboxylase
MSIDPAARLIIALDLPTIADAERLVARTGEGARFFKIGYQLFPVGGYELARQLVAAGTQVFLDAKLFDIGATVERGVRSMSDIGASILTVHADPDTVAGAVQGRADPTLKIFAVTVLTSWSEETLLRHGLAGPVLDQVLRRAELAAESGADGVIASATEASEIRQRFGNRLQIVTPGVRPAGDAAHDQKRIMTPADAIAAGADRLVVGRPITQADDPAGKTAEITAEISQALAAHGARS